MSKQRFDELESLCFSDSSKIIKISDDAKKLGIGVAYSFAWGKRVVEIDPGLLERAIKDTVRHIREKYNLSSLRKDPIVRAYRDFYWRIGIDPTKTRPSGEALVRRILRGYFPRINPIVDAGNLASAKTLVSIGLYDVSQTCFPCELRISMGGEVFKPIGGRITKLGKGMPILVDSCDKVLHVFPYRDSIDTAVTGDTTSVWVVAAIVPGVPKDLAVEAVHSFLTYARMLGWSICKEIHVIYKVTR